MTYLHLFMATLVSSISADNPVSKSYLVPLGFALLAFVLLIVLLLMRPGFLKYGVFVLFLFCIGQSIGPFVSVLEDKNVLRKTLAMVAGIFIGMSALAFYDKQNFLGFGPYLFAGLVGLVLARVGLWIASLAEAPLSDIRTWDQILSYMGVVLFTVYVAYDTQNLKKDALSVKGTPDYINSSLNLYLDILNLFTNVGDLMD